MNETVKNLLNHRSIRKYENKPIPNEVLEYILKCTQAAPTSINGQQYSVIVVTDQEKKSQIAELAGKQTYIDEAPVFLLFVMDYHRAALAAELHGEELVITESIESIMVGSVDIGIALGTAIAAAESLGLGIVPIGGVRRSPQEIIELLDLPQYVYPVAGLVLGYGAEMPEQKPRIPMSMFRHDNAYNSDQREALKQYDTTISEYMIRRTAGEKDTSWSQAVSSLYKKVYYPKVYETLKNKGFKNDK